MRIVLSFLLLLMPVCVLPFSQGSPMEKGKEIKDMGKAYFQDGKRISPDSIQAALIYDYPEARPFMEQSRDQGGWALGTGILGGALTIGSLMTSLVTAGMFGPIGYDGTMAVGTVSIGLGVGALVSLGACLYFNGESGKNFKKAVEEYNKKRSGAFLMPVEGGYALMLNGIF